MASQVAAESTAGGVWTVLSVVVAEVGELKLIVKWGGRESEKVILELETT
jgi:hypothetical protein